MPGGDLQVLFGNWVVSLDLSRFPLLPRAPSRLLLRPPAHTHNESPASK